MGRHKVSVTGPSGELKSERVLIEDRSLLILAFFVLVRVGVAPSEV